jgi:hypothetical protein
MEAERRGEDEEQDERRPGEGSLKSLPPAWRGTSVYQEMYAGSSQK